VKKNTVGVFLAARCYTDIWLTRAKHNRQSSVQLCTCSINQYNLHERALKIQGARNDMVRVENTKKAAAWIKCFQIFTWRLT